MSSMLKKIQKKVIDLIMGPPDDDPFSKKEKKSESGNYEDTDTASMDDDELVTFARRMNKPQDDIDDSQYWWCYQGDPPLDVVPVFEEIDDAKVSDELNKKLDADEFPLIEIPENITKTLRILNNPEFSYADVSSLIHHSPSMAGEFIRVINSSLYSRGIDISDLKLALPRLGRENVKALLYMYSSKLSFSGDPLFNDLAVEIVEHSYATALIAAFLSQRYYPDPDGAFLAGLLHDIGKLGILKAISDTYKLPKKVHFQVTEEIFDNILPQLHPKAGKFLATHWRVDDNIISSIEHHHDFFDFGFPEEEQLAHHLSALINLSDTMARILKKGRRIDKVNIFDLSATIDLAMDRNHETIKFLDNIPQIVAFKTSET
ncbi:MAG: hypothetical protein A2017_21605 [Lentisphaerae bacterium GWF2_44_16]|nr:MAG: hypothetical protein A2017_21605 [Lentisphaerae bacterium GWF2_44_16]